MDGLKLHLALPAPTIVRFIAAITAIGAGRRKQAAGTVGEEQGHGASSQGPQRCFGGLRSVMESENADSTLESGKRQVARPK